MVEHSLEIHTTRQIGLSTRLNEIESEAFATAWDLSFGKPLQVSMFSMNFYLCTISMVNFFAGANRRPTRVSCLGCGFKWVAQVISFIPSDRRCIDETDENHGVALTLLYALCVL